MLRKGLPVMDKPFLLSVSPNSLTAACISLVPCGLCSVVRLHFVAYYMTCKNSAQEDKPMGTSKNHCVISFFEETEQIIFWRK